MKPTSGDARIRHCAAGHAITGENLEVSGGRERCKRCLVEIRMRYYYKNQKAISAARTAAKRAQREKANRQSR